MDDPTLGEVVRLIAVMDKNFSCRLSAIETAIKGLPAQAIGREEYESDQEAAKERHSGLSLVVEGLRNRLWQLTLGVVTALGMPLVLWLLTTER